MGKTTVSAVQSKPLWKSKTFWFNIIATIIALLSAPQIVELVGPAVGVSTVTAVVAALNVIVRLWTHGPVIGSPGATSAIEGQPAALLASVAAETPTLMEEP